jgi:Inosine-uridine nucleoside N-ribohydrolase
MALVVAAGLHSPAYGQVQNKPQPTQTTFPKDEPAAERVILDTDIGDDVDDAYALALLCSLPNARILGVTTAYGATRRRAELALKLVRAFGRRGIPVYAGRRSDHPIGRQHDWAAGDAEYEIKEDQAADFILRQVNRFPGEVTLIAIGPLTNLGDLLTRNPDVKGKIKRIVIMGGAVPVGYNNQAPATPEWNIKCDPVAARAVFSSGVPLVMAGLEVTTMMQLDPERQKKLFAYGTRMTDSLAALTNLWGNNVPTLFDPVAVAYGLGYPFCDAEQRRVEVQDDGLTKIIEGAPNVTVLVKPRKDEFLDWFVGIVGKGIAAK